MSEALEIRLARNRLSRHQARRMAMAKVRDQATTEQERIYADGVINDCLIQERMILEYIAALEANNAERT